MRQIVTAVFDSRAEAERARAGLRALGVPSGDIALHTKAEHSETPAGDATQGSEPWLPDLLDTLFRPEPDFGAHDVALQRGGVAVTARVERHIAPAAVRTLDAAGGRYTRNATDPVSATS
jgi:hypothetical protein